MGYDFRFIDLFAGIGGMRIPFEELGGRCVFSSEWDKYAQDTYEVNFGERPQGDITKISAESIPDHDILLAGFPCQPFSIIGSGKGFADTRGTLFFEIERILDAKKPEAFLLENVKQLVSHNKGRTFSTILEKLHGLGYHTNWKIMNALDYGLPQKRERIIIVGFRHKYPFAFPQPKPNRPRLVEFLESHELVDKKHFVSDRIARKRFNTVNKLSRVSGEKVNKLSANSSEIFQKLTQSAGRKMQLLYAGDKKIPKPAIWHENKGGNIGIHEYSCALRAGASYNYLLVDGVRRLTPRECLNLQGFPKDFKIVVADAQLRKQAGNSVPVNMIREVAKRMVKTISAKTNDEQEHDIYA